MDEKYEKKIDQSEQKLIIHTNEEKNEYVLNILLEAIANYLYEKNFKPQSFESCI